MGLTNFLTDTDFPAKIRIATCLGYGALLLVAPGVALKTLAIEEATDTNMFLASMSGASMLVAGTMLGSVVDTEHAPVVNLRCAGVLALALTYVAVAGAAAGTPMAPICLAWVLEESLVALWQWNLIK